MNKSARKAVNLSVLQRHDPHISDIIDSSSYVVVYKFDEDSQAWTKKGVEGTLFVFKRSTLPSYGFFIMNRLGLDNLMADLTGDMALQLTSDYIIYRDEKDIHGIWIYEPTDRDRIGEKLVDCTKKAKEDSNVITTEQEQQQPSTPSYKDRQQHQQTAQSKSPASGSPADSRSSTMAINGTTVEDPLTKMLSEAMSRARVSETSGTPLISQDHLQPQSQPAASSTVAHASSAAQREPQSSALGSQSQSADPTKPEIPSFLMAIISKEQDKPAAAINGSPSLQQQSLKDKDSATAQSMLLNSLTGSGKQSPIMERGSVRQNGPPLSAEFLPASVMPSGLYSSHGRFNGASAGGQGPPQHQHPPNHSHPPPSSAMATASLINRPTGVPAHGSPLQVPAFAYSPGMMPSPLAMPPHLQGGGPMMRPPPPPPHPFHHHPGLVGGHPPPPSLPHGMGPGMGMPPLPPPPPGQGGPSFPADAMHAAMRAVGFMQQQQRGFLPVGQGQSQGPGQEGQGAQEGGEVLSKAEFAQQFLGLLQSDPQFMDVLYSNYAAVLARR
ncbi:hypothetical protein EDD11_009830 [Mortierella claussenii]|nr:hypothetical protein EDD11_009830 [Mortierella claussenii]